MEISDNQNLNPWIHIWFRPRRTIHVIQERDSEGLLYLLASIGGMVNVLDRLSDRAVGDSLGVVPILAIILIGGPIAGIIGMYIAAGILSWTGSWFNGQAATSDIAQVYAWSNVLLLPLLLFWIGAIIIVGPIVLGSEEALAQADISILGALILLGFIVVVAITYIWSIAVFIIMLAEVQQFSIWKALASVLIPLLVIGIPLALIILA